MKKSEYILGKLCGIICVVGGVFALILFAVKGVSHISSVLFVVFMFILGVGLLLLTPKPLTSKMEEERRDELKRIVEERETKEVSEYDKVLIAHYDTGNVKDPLGLLHNERGKPVLLNKEKILHIVDGVFLHAHKWHLGKFFQASTMTTFSDAGSGCIYITNNRMIYLREPSPTRQLSEGGPLGTPKYMPLAAQAKEWLEKGRMEGISIPVKNIVEITRKGMIRKKVYIKAILDEYRYEIFIRPINDLDKLLLSAKQERLHPVKDVFSQTSNIVVICPHCQTSFQITPTKKPFKVKCPNCSKSSLLR